MRTRTTLAVMAVVAGVVVSAAGAAQARVVAAATAPSGYQVVPGVITSAPSSAQDSGADTLCPSGTVAWGGGVAFRGGGAAGETIGTSDPAGSAGWNTLVNNTSGATQTFVVDALCATKPSRYKIVSASAANPAGAQTAVSVTCPAKTVVLSAGIFSTSDSSSVAMTSLWPASSTKVTGKMLNGSASSATEQVEAVCGAKPAKYTIAKFAIDLGADNELEGGAPCPSGTSVVGGGINVASPGKNRTISANTDEGPTGWNINLDNNTTSTVKVTTYAICAA
jgi:hypothetical protein